MTLNEYQKLAVRTANRGFYPASVPVSGQHNFDVMTFALGLTGEAGEVAELIKKGIGHGHGVSAATLNKELGDVLWYLAALARKYGIDLDQVAVANIEKLKARYPDGFSSEASKARVDVQSREGFSADAQALASYNPCAVQSHPDCMFAYCDGSPCSSCGR